MPEDSSASGRIIDSARLLIETANSSLNYNDIIGFRDVVTRAILELPVARRHELAAYNVSFGFPEFGHLARMRDLWSEGLSSDPDYVQSCNKVLQDLNRQAAKILEFAASC